MIVLTIFVDRKIRYETFLRSFILLAWNSVKPHFTGNALNRYLWKIPKPIAMTSSNYITFFIYMLRETLWIVLLHYHKFCNFAISEHKNCKMAKLYVLHSAQFSVFCWVCCNNLLLIYIKHPHWLLKLFFEASSFALFVFQLVSQYIGKYTHLLQVI